MTECPFDAPCARYIGLLADQDELQREVELLRDYLVRAGHDLSDDPHYKAARHRCPKYAADEQAAPPRKIGVMICPECHGEGRGFDGALCKRCKGNGQLDVVHG